MSIARDKYRSKTGGRNVGEAGIMQYPKKLKQAYSEYMKDGNDLEGVVDRIMKFKWIGQADPRKGSWKKEEDHRFSLKRTLKAKRND